jgi:hypothetical protein
MIEFLLELLAYCLRFFRAEVPNCELILSELQAGSRSGASTGAYVWLCRLTGWAELLRWLAGACLASVILDLVVHSRIDWPPFNFEDAHKFYVAASFGPGPTAIVFQYCEQVAIVSTATCVALALSFDGLARLCRLLVRECCPRENKGRDASA